MTINNYREKMMLDQEKSLKDTSILLKTGERIEVREPSMNDVGIMLEFINTLSKEDIYLNANPENLFDESQERQYVAECMYRLKHGTQVHLLALFDGKLIGSITVTKQAMRQTHVGVFGITIASEWRGKGLGESLTTIALSQAGKLGMTTIILDAFAKNKPAISLYKKLGFVEYGLLPKGFIYKGSLEDKVLMYKTLL
jgi:RimJ/RimL family protein N-acetyltransferase